MPDVIVIGGGHNGLVAAAYIAMTGLKVTVLERRTQVGGAAATEEFYPGFRNSVAAYTVSLLNPTIIRDLELHRHGLRIVERPLPNFLPLPDGPRTRRQSGRPRRRRRSRKPSAFARPQRTARPARAFHPLGRRRPRPMV